MSRKTKSNTFLLSANNLLKNKKKGKNYRCSNAKMKVPEGCTAKEDQSVEIFDRVDFMKIMNLVVSLIVSQQKSRQSNRKAVIMFPV